mgnify:CR=1 FL=1
MNLRQQFKRIGERQQEPAPQPLSNDIEQSLALDEIAPLDMSFDDLVAWYDEILPRVKVMIDIGGLKYGKAFVEEATRRVRILTERCV